MPNVIEMPQISVVNADSEVTLICYENATSGVGCDLSRLIELSISWSYTPYLLLFTHLKHIF